MMIDSQLAFVGINTNLSLVGGAGVSIASTNVIDLLGQGIGTAPASIIGLPTSGLFGTDLGVGENPEELQVTIGTGLASANGALLNVAFQAAPDTAVTHLPGTWQTLIETGALPLADTAAGAIIARFKFPVAVPANLQPRYVRLLFNPGIGANFSAGTIQSAFITPVRDDWSMKYAARNYTVA
jgi:hypothetical protein